MAQIICRKKGSTVFVELKGDALLQWIPKAKELFGTLVSGNCTECHISVAEVKEIDLPYIELLSSFRRTMAREHKKVIFEPLPNDHPLTRMLCETGVRYARFCGEVAQYGI